MPSTAWTWPMVRRMIPEFFTGKYIRRLSTVRIGLAEKSALVIACGSKIAPVSMSREPSLLGP
jgi:hypothetical protein